MTPMSSHAYPLAIRLEDALKSEAKAARTRGQAEDMADGFAVECLSTDWLNVTEEEADAFLKAADSEAVAAHGHLQRYEDNQGKPVLAVTWWKLVPVAAKKAKPKKKPAIEKPPAEDHTDDLYFRSGRTKPGRRRYVDPRQMDLFKDNR